MVTSTTTAITTNGHQNVDSATVAPNGNVSINDGIANNTNTKVLQGKYTFVGIDIDTTGRRLIDEIVQLAAYTPKNHFEQYIMPYMNLNPAARQRHQVRVISIGFYRMLKSMQTYKIIKSKSEIAALKDFLDWLEMIKAKDATSQGVILVYYEERKFIPYMILESLKKYNLLDRFLKSVHSFVNGLHLAKTNSNEALQHYSLRKLSKVLSAGDANKTVTENDANNNTVSNNVGDSNENGGGSELLRPPEQSSQKKTAFSGNSGGIQNDRDLFDGNASVRARLAYEVALQLSAQKEGGGSKESDEFYKMLAALRAYVTPVYCDLNELQTQNENLERQNSFRPVFLNYFKTTLYHRVRAVKFRIILAEHRYDLQTLYAIWSQKKRDGVIEVLNVIDELKAEDRTELADLFDSYFDPSKTTIKPVLKSPNNRRRNRRGVRINSRNNDGTRASEQGAGGDKQGAGGAHVPDSTTKSPPTSGGIVNGGSSKQHRGKRNPRPRNNSLKTQTQTTSPQADGRADAQQQQQNLVPLAAAGN